LPLDLADEPHDRAVTAEMEALDDVAQQSPLVRTLLEQASPFADELAQAVELVDLAPLQAATPEPVELEVLPEPAPEPAPLPVLATEPQPLPGPIFDPAGMQRRLTSSGLDERLARELVAQAESELRFFDPTEPFGQQVRTVLARRIRVARAPRKSGRRVIALVGPSGSGKTLTAARLCYAHRTVAGRSVAALSLEPVREAFELARHTKGLDVELVVADESATLEQKLEKLSTAELLVVDTPACDPQDEDRLRMLALLLELIGPDETHLLVPAALGTSDVGVLLDTVAPALGADRLMVTHRDGPGGIGAAVSASIRSKLPISFTATGNAWGLRPADPYELAGLVVQ
jgi:flagellar biosynthesis GTPase FlhF